MAAAKTHSVTTTKADARFSANGRSLPTPMAPVAKALMVVSPPRNPVMTNGRTQASPSGLKSDQNKPSQQATRHIDGMQHDGATTEQHQTAAAEGRAQTAAKANAGQTEPRM